MKRAITASILIVGLAQTAAAQGNWFEDFDSYPLGTRLDNVGGWTGWDNNSAYAGLVTSIGGAWNPQSLQVDPASGGPVHEFSSLTGGKWTFRLHQHLPAGFANDQAYVVINNVYEAHGPKEFAVRIHCDPATGKVVDDLRPEANSIDIRYDQWAEIRFEIDLDADTIDTYYNMQLLSTGTYAIAGGPKEIANVNFWTDRFATSPAYYDYITLENACYADCNVSTGVGVMDIFDFLCFQDAFINEEYWACDCEYSWVCDIFDFLCFQRAFVAGCP